MATVTGSKRHLDITSDTLTTSSNVDVGAKLFITTTDSNTTSTTALVLNGDEVEARTLGSNAFNSTAFLTSETFSSSDVVMSLSGDDIIAGTSITLAGGLSYNDTTNTLSQTDNNTTYSAGTLLDLSGTTFNVDLTELTNNTATFAPTQDHFVILDNGVQAKKLGSSIFGSAAYEASSAFATASHTHGGVYVPEYESLQPSGSDKAMNVWRKTHAVLSDSGGVSTYIIVQTEVPQDNYSMGGFTLVYQDDYYTSGEGGEIKIYGYWNPESNGGFEGFRYECSNPYHTPTIEVCRNSSSGNTAFFISGEGGNYSQLIAKDLWLGYTASSATQQWGNGWTITQASDKTGYTNFNTLNRNDFPAITTDGSTPSLTGGVTASEVRTLIGAGTSSSDTTYSAGTGLTLTNTTFSLSVAGTNVGGVKSGTDITVDSSGNVSVNNDSHTHDGRYYTETESDTRFTRKYTFNPGSTSSGNRYYVKLFTLDNFDDGVSGILSAAGDYGDADKAMYHIQIGTRTSLSFDVYQTSHSAVADDYNFYYRQAANDDYEIWVRMADYNQNNTFTVLSQFGTVTYNFDSQTLEVPTGLTEVTKHKMYHSGNLSAGTNVSISSSGVISSTDTTYTAATTSANGLMSSTDKTKLDGIESGADVTDSTNVATAGALMASGNTLTGTMKVTGSIIHEFNNGGGYIPFPKGAYYVTTSSSHTGAIKIKLPVHGTDDMLKFVVDIFDYSTGESVTMNIAGYLYQTTGNNEWTNCTVTTLTERTDRDYTVRFGADGTNNCLWIGETNSTWSYPQVIVRDFYGGYSMDVDAYDDNWSISFETSFDTVDETISDNLPTADWDRIEGKPGNATTSADGFMSSTDKTKLDGIASGADVTPSWVPATDPSYITGLSFNGLSSKTSGTGDYATTGDLVSGKSSGGVALTINDGYGNANITWNHQNGIPEQNGNAARIEVNTDSSTGATMYFEIKSGMTSGTAAALTNVMKMTESGFETETGKDITSGGRLYVSTLDTNTTSTAALVLGSSNEIEQRALGDMAFSSSESFATADHSHSDATTSASGFMSSTDKTKLDGISTGADVTPSWVPASDPSYLTALPTHNHDSRYFRRYTGQASQISNTGYRTAFTVDGGNLASSIRFSVQGTTGSVVVSNVIDVLVNHYQDIVIEANSGVYTRLYVKVTSNDNEDFAVDLKTNSSNAVTLDIEVLAYGNETVTFTTSHSYSGATLELDCEPGKTFRATGGDNGDHKIYGTYKGDGSGLTNVTAVDLSTVASPTATIQVGAGTSNTGNRSGVALLGESVSGGVANALGLVNTAAAANSNGVALNFHNANNYSPTGQIIVQQNSSGTTTHSAMKFYTYGANNLTHQMSIKSDGVIRFLSYGAGLIASDANGNLSVDTNTYLTGIANNSVGITQLNVSDGSEGQVLTTDGAGNLSFTTVSGGSSYTLPAASSSALGGVKIGYTANAKNYPVQLDASNKAYVNVPWTDANTTYSAGSGLDLNSGAFSVEADLRDGITHVGVSTNNYITFDNTNNHIDFYAGGAHVARMEADGDLHIKGDVIAFSTLFA